MVHALQEAWRALKSGGHLVDMRPITSHPPVDVLSDGGAKRAGRIDDAAGKPDDDAADGAIANAVKFGHFEEQETQTFELLDYWNDVQGMVDYIQDRWSDSAKIPPGTIENANNFVDQASGEVKIRVTQEIMISRYAKRD